MTKKLAGEALGLAGGQKSHVEARQCGASRNVLGEHGHQESIHRGEIWECRTDHGGSQNPRVDHCSLSREMAGLEGQAMFECVERKFSFARCFRQGGVEAPRLWQKMAQQLLASVEEVWVTKKKSSVRLWWRDVKIYKCKDVPWRVTFWRPLLFGCGNWSWSHATVDRIKGCGNKGDKSSVSVFFL